MRSHDTAVGMIGTSSVIAASVELGKQWAKTTQNEMVGGDSGGGHDASTEGLLAFYREFVKN